MAQQLVVLNAFLKASEAVELARDIVKHFEDLPICSPTASNEEIRQITTEAATVSEACHKAHATGWAKGFMIGGFVIFAVVLGVAGFSER
jgi:hypothetical protein